MSESDQSLELNQMLYQWTTLSDQMSSLSGSSTSLSTSIDSIDTNITDFKAKVDRKLLSRMLEGTDTSMESAQDFFAMASSQSGAIISFPQIWKLQIMGKKDPEIQIIGTPSQISSARSLIMNVMDPYRNRVVLKIDVSFVDHSFIIGKGGKRIKSIMDLTQTQIHFPDENLLNTSVKSNIVTITSDSLRSADEARQYIRQSLPLTVSFQVSVNSEKLCFLDIKHPMIEYYQRRFNVIITFKFIESTALDALLVNVNLRGSRQHFDQLHEATRTLYTLLHSSYIGFNSKIITINLEVASRHQSFVMGLNNCNIRNISNRTGAIISFLGLDGNHSSMAGQSSSVTIKGAGIESAFMGWLQLIQYLPVVLIFDIKSEQMNCQLMSALMAKNQMLSIKICPKMNSQRRTLVLKTEERHIHLLFEARQQILNLREEPNIISVTPSHLLSNWNRNYGRLATIPFIPQEVLDSEPEVFRSNQDYL